MAYGGKQREHVEDGGNSNNSERIEWSTIRNDRREDFDEGTSAEIQGSEEVGSEVTEVAGDKGGAESLDFP